MVAWRLLQASDTLQRRQIAMLSAERDQYRQALMDLAAQHRGLFCPVRRKVRKLLRP